MKLKAKKPLPHLTVKAAKSASSDSLQAKADTSKGQLKLALAIPDPQGPMFGSAFLDIARNCELPEGVRGALMLSQLRHLDEAAQILRLRYKDLLRDNPLAVPGWAVERSQVREIFDTAGAFELVKDRPVLRIMFLQYCKVQISKLEKALAATEGDGSFERIFGELIAIRETQRLVQLQGQKLWAQQQRIEEGGEDA